MAFEIPGITVAALQSTVLAATSNILAQAITSFRNDTPLVIDWVPFFQFTLFQFLNTHPNILWQEYLETTFPAHHASPTSEAVASASKGDDKALEKSAKDGKLVEPKLNVTNTAIKFLLDNTIGAAVNTLLFSFFIHSAQQAMNRPLGAPLSTPDQSINYLMSKGSIDYSKVDWQTVKEKSFAEFWPFITAGWKLWPAISLINFAFVKTVNGRILVGSLAGVVWGIYLSLFGGK